MYAHLLYKTRAYVERLKMKHWRKVAVDLTQKIVALSFILRYDYEKSTSSCY